MPNKSGPGNKMATRVGKIEHAIRTATCKSLIILDLKGRTIKSAPTVSTLSSAALLIPRDCDSAIDLFQPLLCIHTRQRIVIGRGLQLREQLGNVDRCRCTRLTQGVQPS